MRFSLLWGPGDSDKLRDCNAATDLNPDNPTWTPSCLWNKLLGRKGSRRSPLAFTMCWCEHFPHALVLPPLLPRFSEPGGLTYGSHAVIRRMKEDRRALDLSLEKRQTHTQTMPKRWASKSEHATKEGPWLSFTVRRAENQKALVLL